MQDHKSGFCKEFEHYVVNPVYAGVKFKTKEYISEKCLSLVEEQDYVLGIG